MDIPFNEIDIAWLNKYEKWLRSKGNRETTISLLFRTLRSAYNKAIKAKCARKSDYPFDDYKINKFDTTTQKRAIAKTDVLKFTTEVQPIGKQQYMELSKDIFVFSYLCGGINFTDIANLTNENIQNGRLHYIRQKTKKPIKIGIPQEAMQIIEKYSKESKGYLFPILDSKIHKTALQKQNRIHKILGKVNKNLKLLAAQLGVEANLTTYVARHSFASVLKKSGVNIALISEALGHSDTRQPSIYDLLSVPDYTNPLNITMGNPGLKPAFGQSISVNYRGGNMEKQEMLYCGLRYNNTINDISRKRTYDEKSGVYTSRPENINGNWGIGGNIYYTNKLFKKIFARLATNANYNRRVSYVQIMGEANENDRNTSQMLSLMQDVEFAYKLEEHEFKINGAITYQQADNSYTNNSDYRTYDFYYGAECRLKLPLNLNLYTVVRSMNRRGYKDEASNTTQWLWNGELTYSFLKGKRGLLKFQVVDILQQRDFVNRWMNDTGQGETWTWGLGRYAMATFTYRFNDLSR